MKITNIDYQVSKKVDKQENMNIKIDVLMSKKSE